MASSAVFFLDITAGDAIPLVQIPDEACIMIDYDILKIQKNQSLPEIFY